jgi:hypothetical protein
MEFKCKNCNSTKYRQISISVKQCEECGMQIKSEGIVDPKVLDCTEEPDNNVKKYGKIDFSVNPESFSDFLKTKKRIRPDGMIEYYIDGDWI